MLGLFRWFLIIFLSLFTLILWGPNFVSGYDLSIDDIENKSFSGSLANLEDVAMDFCSPENELGARSFFRKKVHKDSRVPLCLEVKNNSELYSLLSYKIVTMSGDSCTTVESDIAYDSIFNGAISGSAHANKILGVSPYSEAQITMELDTEDMQKLEGCITISSYYPEHIENKITRGLFKVQVVRTKKFSIEIIDDLIELNVGLRQHSFTGLNLLEDSVYHLAPYENSYLLTYQVSNTGNIFATVGTSLIFSNILREYQYNKRTDLPPQTQKVIYFLLPKHRYDLGYYNVSLSQNTVFSLKSEQKLEKLDNFDSSYRRLTPIVYFFALLVIIIYNIFARFTKRR